MVFDFTTNGERDCVAAVERLSVLFGIMNSIVGTIYLCLEPYEGH